MSAYVMNEMKDQFCASTLMCEAKMTMGLHELGSPPWAPLPPVLSFFLSHSCYFLSFYNDAFLEVFV